MMKRLLAVAVVPALVLLAGCGTDTCSSSPATAINQSPSCSLAPGADTITVQLCAKCSDSSPGCQAEPVNCSGDFSNCRFEVSPTVQQCQANAGCAINGCNTGVPTASCPITIPAGTPTNATYPLVIVGEQTFTGSVTVGGSNTSCAL